MMCRSCRERAARRRRWGENGWLLGGLFLVTLALWWLRQNGVIQ